MGAPGPPCDAVAMLLRPALLLLPALLATGADASVPAPGWRQGWGLAGPAAQARGSGRTTGQDGVRLQLQPVAGQVQVWAEHRGTGPVQVRLHAGPGSNLVPVVRELPRPGRWLLATLDGGQRNQRLLLDVVPGPVQPRVDAGHAYALPFDPATGVRVHQGAHGQASHHDAQNRHAWDFALPEGTPVLAARGGRVIAVHAASPGPGTRPGDGGNLVRVLHEDGSMAVYAHLQPGSIAVAPGQRVVTGQRLAASGNTGYSRAPHLHFVVQVNAGLALASIPVQVNGPQGRLLAAGSAGPAPL